MAIWIDPHSMFVIFDTNNCHGNYKRFNEMGKKEKNKCELGLYLRQDSLNVGLGPNALAAWCSHKSVEHEAHGRCNGWLLFAAAHCPANDPGNVGLFRSRDGPRNLALCCSQWNEEKNKKEKKYWIRNNFYRIYHQNVSFFAKFKRWSLNMIMSWMWFVTYVKIVRVYFPSSFIMYDLNVTFHIIDWLQHTLGIYEWICEQKKKKIHKISVIQFRRSVQEMPLKINIPFVTYSNIIQF